MFDPDGEVTNLKGIKGFALLHGKRIMHKILNRRQHAGHHIRLDRRRVSCDDMVQKQPGLPVNQKNLFNPIPQGVEEHHLGKGLSRLPGFKTPPQSP